MDEGKTPRARHRGRDAEGKTPRARRRGQNAKGLNNLLHAFIQNSSETFRRGNTGSQLACVWAFWTNLLTFWPNSEPNGQIFRNQVELLKSEKDYPQIPRICM